MGKPAVHRKPAGRRLALQIVAVYLLVGAAWIISARKLIFNRNIDPNQLSLLHTLEGWAFLLSTAFLFYLLISRHLRVILHREAEEKDALVSDITVQKHLVEALDQAREHYRLLFEHIAQGVVYRDGEGRILAVNPAAERILGIPGAELLGRTSIDPQGKALRADGTPLSQQERPFRVALDSGREVRDEVIGLFNPQEGAYRWVSVDTVPQIQPGATEPFQILSTLNDITERRLVEEKVQNLAFYDSLTGLPNRRLLLDRLSQAMAQANREGKLLGLAFLDLDHFKTINDTLGHASGDTLLRAVAERLQQCIRKSDTVARLGGDEFVVILTNLEHADGAAAIAEKILEIFIQPFRLGEREIFTSTSIGLALYPLDAGNGEELLSRADMAMYRAKERGRNLFQFFAPQMNEEAMQRLVLHNELNRALLHSELLLFFQDKISLATGDIIGVEALLRWRHPERGLLRPADFLPLAEESGLIIPIGEWVLRTACIQGMTWQRMGLPALRIAINVSGRQLRHGDLVETVSRALAETGFPAASLELEFREESLLEETEQAPAALAALRKLGVSCALDDFGTGLSAIGRIRTFPLDRINIHHSLIQNFATAENTGLIQGIIDLAHNLRLQVIAEGVETEEQKLFLQSLGCDEVQGFHFRLPVPAEELTERLSLCRTGSAP
ncbi:MAG TPA: EAL domain-containing protein [Desulfuromonadales bacterium]|nr:EAL domain-containing protein [Desulfuromonadales bacterium]